MHHHVGALRRGIRKEAPRSVAFDRGVSDAIGDIGGFCRLRKIREPRAESREPRAEKEAVEASLAGDVRKAFEKLGSSVAEVKADNIAGAVAARWLKLSLEQRENTGVMAPSHALRGAINGRGTWKNEQFETGG